MKKLKVLLAACLVVIAAVITATAAACSGSSQATLVGLYYKDGTVNTGSGESYTLEVYDDGTYELTYRQSWHLGESLSLTYGRLVTSYGTYEVTAEDETAGTTTYHLAAPDRMQLIAYHRLSTLIIVDTADWPEDGITYTLYERAETEIWETADEFIAAYGREYDMTWDSIGYVLNVSVVGEQIPVDAAVVVD